MTKDEMKAAFEEMHGPGAWDRLQRMQEGEKQAVMDLGKRIGFGRIMQLAQQLWGESLKEQGLGGGEFAYGPCVAMLVDCICVENKTRRSGCDWCCGTGKVTKKVRAAAGIDEAQKKLHVLWRQSVGKPIVSRLIPIMKMLDPNLIVHALDKGFVVCGREKERAWMPETLWPPNEVWVGIKDNLVSCPGCLEAIVGMMQP